MEGDEVRRIGKTFAVVFALTMSAAVVHASGTAAGNCAAAKSKAAAKKLAAKLKCYQKALSSGSPVDTTCLGAADTKFTAAVGKAETKGGCAFTGDAPTLEAVVDKAVNTINAFDPAAPLVCCAGAACTYAPDAAACTGLGAVPGAPGTVCDGATGSCVTPPASAGNCCTSTATNFGLPAGFGNCIGGTAGAAGDASNCSALSGKFESNGICPPDGSDCVTF
jgi:hypothetical protein